MKQPSTLSKIGASVKPTAKARKFVANDASTQILESARRNELVIIVGAGVSVALTKGCIPSWKGLIESGFRFGVTKGTISDAQRDYWQGQLTSVDIDDLLGAAHFMQRKLGGQDGELYARWLESIFKNTIITNDDMVTAVKAIHDAGIPICTLNYDQLLEQITGLPTISIRDKGKLTGWMRGESAGILHLHGSWDQPSGCILGIVDYETTLADEVRKIIQQSLGAFKRLLFIGCGDTFGDPNFSALISWCKQHLGTAFPQHYALVNEAELEGRHADVSWHGFVDPISYGEKHADLPSFIRALLSPISISRPTKSSMVTGLTATQARVIEAYRTFLLKDCGQMTIEGVRADMDTAQRKFDLERLFVPLELQAVPPDIPAQDPDREQKLRSWQEKNKSPSAFGALFKKNKRLALLALPGGGKTILLKRLAVAYSDLARRRTCTDDLPDLNLTPIIIRCRDWREHIRRPLLSMLQNIVEVTGNPELEGLHEALIPLLKKGQVLLLIDGLDEIHNDGDRATFVENLETFIEDYKNIRVVVTSREAGFSLVAPTLARFCTRWRIAPLNEAAIRSLCDYWHLLMSGDSPDSVTESREVAERILGRDSLRRLSETPLLLTMLLVVKHGYGRLPPDRVSLYDRAVEVLLDTWNIKGHQALDPKEAVPQLAYVAFRLMQLKQQTVTENDLLRLLTEAREKVPQIGLYANDTPHAFLNRVELRSSLLIEAGRQLEGGRIVRLYQFRHLTFQEYLAAVAAAEGHFPNYNEGNTVLTPVEQYLKNEEWKEVIPMAAVLAKKRAEPIIAALVADAEFFLHSVNAGSDFQGNKEWLGYPGKLPSPIALLVQCLAEEAQAIPSTLAQALKLIAKFAMGCRTQDDWIALSRGPYSGALLQEVWKQYSVPLWRHKFRISNTFASLLRFKKPALHYLTPVGLAEIDHLLSANDAEHNTTGLMICVGALWEDKDERFAQVAPLAIIKKHFLQHIPGVWPAAAWALGLANSRLRQIPDVSAEVLDHLLDLLTGSTNESDKGFIEFALSGYIGMERTIWTPKLNPAQIDFIKRTILKVCKNGTDAYSVQAALVVAFHSGDVWPDQQLIKVIERTKGRLISHTNNTDSDVRRMLDQLGAIEKKHLKGKSQKIAKPR